MSIKAILTKQTYAAFVIASGVLLTSCGSQPVKTLPDTPKTNHVLNLDDINTLINTSNLQTEPTRSQNLILAGEALFKLNAFDRAKNILLSANTNQLNQTERVTYSIVLANINLKQGNPFKAKFYLWQPDFMQAVNQSDNNTQITVYDKRATLLFDIAEYENSVNERIILGTKLTSNDDIDMRMLNQDLLWQALMAMPNARLTQLSQTSANKTARGWYRLAALSKDNQNNLQQQLHAVDLWRSAWPNHPASAILPADLQLLEQLVATQPKHIAVLLPLSGKLKNAAQTILDGFMAAHFNIHNQSTTQPTIKVYDTNNTKIDHIYDQAVENGAQFIIGPLDKDNIAILAKRKQLAVPTLALNYLETPPENASTGQYNSVLNGSLAPGINTANQTNTTHTAAQQKPIGELVKTPNYRLAPADSRLAASNTQTDGNATQNTLDPNTERALYQFGLALEDEAKQVASKAFRDGHRRAMIITPATPFGRRGSDQFTQDWTELGGQVVQVAEFSNQKEYSQLIEAALGVRASLDRARQLARVIGATDDFEPRRRQDIDMVFLLARPSQARQIKPILNFHYASDIPIYATSHIYNGQNNTGLNRDMNGILFTALPWFFDDQSPEKQDVIQYGHQKQGSAFYPLYAFGVDAYRLYPRLKQLKNIEQARFYGATGSLSVDRMQRIKREQTWAKFISGEANEISITSTQASQTD